MITVTLAALLVPYGIVCAFFLLFAVANAYHMIHYSETTKVSFVVTFTFYAVSVLILFFTWNLLQGTDWQQTFTIGYSNTL